MVYRKRGRKQSQKGLNPVLKTLFPPRHCTNIRKMHITPLEILSKFSASFDQGLSQFWFSLRGEGQLDMSANTTPYAMIHGGVMAHGSNQRLLAALRAAIGAVDVSAYYLTEYRHEMSSTRTTIQNVSNAPCKITCYEFQSLGVVENTTNPLDAMADDWSIEGATVSTVSVVAANELLQTMLDTKLSFMLASRGNYFSQSYKDGEVLGKYFKLCVKTVYVLAPGESFTTKQKSMYGIIRPKRVMFGGLPLWRPLLYHVETVSAPTSAGGSATSVANVAGYVLPNLVMTVKTWDTLRFPTSYKPIYRELIPPIWSADGAAPTSAAYIPQLSTTISAGGHLIGGVLPGLPVLQAVNTDYVEVDDVVA